MGSIPTQPNLTMNRRTHMMILYADIVSSIMNNTDHCNGIGFEKLKERVFSELEEKYTVWTIYELNEKITQTIFTFMALGVLNMINKMIFSADIDCCNDDIVEVINRKYELYQSFWGDIF